MDIFIYEYFVGIFMSNLFENFCSHSFPTGLLIYTRFYDFDQQFSLTLVSNIMAGRTWKSDRKNKFI